MELLTKYLENFNHSQEQRWYIKSTLKSNFLRYYNNILTDNQIFKKKSLTKKQKTAMIKNIKRNESELINKELLLNVKIGSFSRYFEFLNNDREFWTLGTKRMYLSRAKNFVKWIMRNYEEYFSILERLEFLNYLNESDNFKWKHEPFHKFPTSNKRTIATKNEMSMILDHYKRRDLEKYYIFYILMFTGMRRFQVCDIRLMRYSLEEEKTVSLEEDLNKRILAVRGKVRRTEIYYIPKQLAILLQDHLKNRLKIKVKTDALFVSYQGKEYNPRTLNYSLKVALKRKGIEKPISPHTFRKTLNTERKRMGCIKEDRKILINHREADVNINHYVILRYDEFLALYDRFNPYKNLRV